MNLPQLDYVGLAIASVLIIVWLVRLEGRVNSKAEASSVQAVMASVDAIKASTIAAVDAIRASTAAYVESSRASTASAVENIKASVDSTKSDVHVLQQAAKAAVETTIEVVRLQEQIKHLTDLIEKWIRPPAPEAAPTRRRRTTTVEEG